MTQFIAMGLVCLFLTGCSFFEDEKLKCIDGESYREYGGIWIKTIYGKCHAFEKKE